jgi:23S rRNA pseudouridine1911/1915/1917 synthase
MKKYKVDEDSIGLRADVFIASKYPQFSRSSLEDLFTNSLVSVDGKQVKPSYKVKPTSIVHVYDDELNRSLPKIELPIIYEDHNLLVINKPAGILTHSKGAFNNEATVATFIKPKLNSDIVDNNRAGIVHRLDRATSGVMICAKNKPTLSFLQKQFSLRKTKKTYAAIVSGIPKEPTAIIDAAIERNPKNPQSFRAGANGKSAVTKYVTKLTFEINHKQYSLVELFPETGRTHQIRVHMAFIGNPIVGDTIYKGEVSEHMYLHSKELEVTIPGSIRKIFNAPLPGYFDNFVNE